jgi:hypothetical protein
MPLMDERRPPAPKEPDSRRGALLGLLVALLLIVLGLIIVRVLGNAGRLQDCVMSGRTNCAPIDTSDSLSSPRGPHESVLSASALSEAMRSSVARLRDSGAPLRFTRTGATTIRCLL